MIIPMRLIPIFLVLILTGCAIGKPAPTSNRYGIQPILPATGTADRAGILRIGNVRVATGFSGEQLVYRMSDVRYVSDFYERFVGEPGPMLGEQLAGWLERTGPFETVTRTASASVSPYVLEALVTELYGDFRPERPPEAVMTIQFTVLDTRAIRPRVALEQGIGQRVEIPEASAEALVRGYNQVLGGILSDLATSLAELPRG